MATTIIESQIITLCVYLELDLKSVSNQVRLFPVNSGILFVTEPLLGLMCRRPIQRECLSDRWCLEQLPISSDEDFVCTYVLCFWYVEKKKKNKQKKKGQI